jgi:FSR family fosmidomycin resistance protein-like MFS transporter
MGFNQTLPWKSEGNWALVLTLALVLGKASGGFLSDWLGPKRAAALSLALSAVLYLFSGVPILGTAAVFLFNMTMPITLWAAARLMPGGKGFAFGLLTFGLFLGFLPTWLGWPSILTQPWAMALAALLSAGLLLAGLKGEKTKCS